MADQWIEAATIVQSQVRETVDQEMAGVTVRSADLTCPCGNVKALVHMYQCLYCKVWFCNSCAEHHFGKTVKQYKAEQQEQAG